ncbi:MAG: glycosyltransferase family 39 protein [Flavobacteriales bacterium]|nr:glycosyltransferase family 39 protein [Flavobacteriales bacterium]
MRTGTLRSPINIILIALILSGIVIRFIHLGTKEFWHDETYSLFNASGLTAYGQVYGSTFDHNDLVARNDLPHVIDACLVNDGGNGFFHSVVLHYWMLIAPHTTTWLRLPSAILGVIVILLVIAMTHDLFGDRRMSLVAGVFCSWSVLLLQGSIDLRGYTLAAALALASTWCLFRILLKSGGRWMYISHAGFAALALLSHYTTVYIFIGHLLVALLLARDRKIWAGLMIGGSVVIVLVAVWLANGGLDGYAVLAARNDQYIAQVKADPDINTFFQATRPSTLVEGIAVQSLWASGNGLQYIGPQLRYIMLLLFLPAALMLWALRNAERGRRRRLMLALLIMAVMSMAFAVVLALNSGHTISFFSRYALFSLPFWCMAMAVGASARPDRPTFSWLGPTFGALTLAIGIWSAIISLDPSSRSIVGPDRYSQQRIILDAALAATSRCEPELIHGSFTSAFLLNLVAWDEEWNMIPQRVEPESDSYTEVGSMGACSFSPIVIVAHDGLYTRSEPKDPIDDVTWH